MTVPIAVTAAVAIFFIGLAIILRRLVARTEHSLPDEAWLNSFSVTRYKPMLRLLAEDDPAYLEELGVGRAAVRQLRARRRKIFRAYLRNLVRDFNRLHLAARVCVLDSEIDRSDVAARLARVRLVFMWAVFAVRCRLVLHTLGLGVVDVRALLDSLASVQADFGAMVPVRQPAVS